MSPKPDQTPLKDGSHLFETEYHAHHLERPGFRITELKLSPTQTVPWHAHTNIADTFYVIDGHLRLFLQQPKETIDLAPGDSHTAIAGRPHLVTNGGDTTLDILVLQGIGDYDYIPLVR
jgi:quercetin dioxygenase-like cupin family protein